jgi:hypothetical protein
MKQLPCVARNGFNFLFADHPDAIWSTVRRYQECEFPAGLYGI